MCVYGHLLPPLLFNTAFHLGVAYILSMCAHRYSHSEKLKLQR